MTDVHNVMPQFSRWLGPRTSGVDALDQDWPGLVAWVNPPFALLERLIRLFVMAAASDGGGGSATARQSKMEHVGEARRGGE